MHLNGHSITLYTTMALYAVSLLLPGLVLTNEVGQTMTQYGYQILMLGWLGIFTGVFSWYGYVLGVVALATLRAGRKRMALICSVVGLLLALQALYLQSVNAQINFGDSFNSWERGMGVLAAGYYLWLFALGVLVIQCVVAYFAKAGLEPLSGH